MLEKGKCVAYGAKAIPEGGWHAMPKAYGNGFLLVGDSGGFLNAARLKGAHLAIKSGMLAGETIFEAIGKSDTSNETLALFEKKFHESWAAKELKSVRDWRAGYEQGLGLGTLHDFIARITGGNGWVSPDKHGDHATLRKVNGRKPERIVPDGKVTFDKMTDVYQSGTVHGETQPCHLVIPNTDLCVNRCTQEFGNPCQHFCPAGVYEWMKDEKAEKGGHVHINAGNCVHCKTCDIKDPYENITWMVPEGGDGPRYQGL
jgi:electron-transferring-flavoprotein dehydrogenase